jgi:alkanesulfonate monooxygenase SsuD/methylene tetrahydromethanopterin reductase-like flavin-dependent oxidoreductase (luciferase family)
VEIGICIPYMERDYTRATTLEWCRRVDAGPFSSLSCGERITSYTQDMRIVLAAAAALTSRVRIVPSLYVLPMHSPVRAAKEIATLDVLSAGRVTVTVGVGGREHDYRAVGAPFEKRHARLDEGVATMRRIWAGEPPFAGADPVGPTPVQPGGPPILVGAMGPKAIRRAAGWADGIYGWSMDSSAAPVKQHFDLARAAWREAGREQRPRLVTGFWYSLADGADRKLKDYVYEYVRIAGEGPARALAGQMRASNEGAIRAALDAIEAEGADECLLVPATLELAEVDRAADLIARRARG